MGGILVIIYEKQEIKKVFSYCRHHLLVHCNVSDDARVHLEADGNQGGLVKRGRR